MNYKILSAKDILDRDMDIKSLIDKICIPINNIDNPNADIDNAYSNKTIKRYIFKGIVGDQISLQDTTNSTDFCVSYIYLPYETIVNIPYNLGKKSVQSFLLNKVITIDTSDNSSILEMLNNKKEQCIEIISGFYKNKKGKWYVTTSTKRISAESLLGRCIFNLNNNYIDGSSVSAYSLKDNLYD